MNTIKPEPRRSRFMALLLTTLLTFPFLSACGSKESSAPPPPVDDTRAGAVQNNRGPSPSPQAKKGLSNAQKVGITLAGAAALYYIYNQHKNKQQEGAQGKYYLSKNGRVYYRDAQNRAHWVTPPPEGIKVPESEAARYRDFQGYNNQTTGKDLTSLPEAKTAVPAQ
ncbi:hypothetical protein C7B69_14275 [filamentous cyanobacterium Phorm 46]|nr:hypothetical protein C7B69_14275 [filamentous cyanobacterium Phorm 46]PSB47476.1 hypothetical protein C7B67_19040 [filamentous cyanobacterium Phorm 6]